MQVFRVLCVLVVVGLAHSYASVKTLQLKANPECRKLVAVKLTGYTDKESALLFLTREALDRTEAFCQKSAL